MKEWFKSLSTTMQIVVFILVLLLVWFLLKSARGFIQSIGKVSESYGEQTALIAQGQQKSYTPSQYNSFADQLYFAMKGLGTDEDAIAQVMGAMQNDLDVITLTNSFGVRDGYNLQGWLRSDLSSSDVEKYVNSILRSKGITKTF